MYVNGLQVIEKRSWGFISTVQTSVKISPNLFYDHLTSSSSVWILWGSSLFNNCIFLSNNVKHCILAKLKKKSQVLSSLTFQTIVVDDVSSWDIILISPPLKEAIWHSFISLNFVFNSIFTLHLVESWIQVQLSSETQDTAFSLSQLYWVVSANWSKT